MKDLSSIKLSGYLLITFVMITVHVFGQLPGEAPSIGNPAPPASPPKTAKAKAKEDLANAQEKLKNIEAENEKTAKKLADFLDALMLAVRTPGDPKSKEIIQQAAKNANLKAIIETLRQHPRDHDLINRIKQMLLNNPAEDPAQKIDGLLKGYTDPGAPPDEQERRKQLITRLESELRRTMLSVKPTGTGRTIGNIANISVDNPTQSYLVTSPQSVFIPSDGHYQPYVGTIPGTLLPPGTTIIPVDGYCADVHKPPVPSGSPMPPMDTWIPVGVPEEIPSGEDFPIISTTPIPPFVPEDIPHIINTPGFTAVPPDPDQDIIITWPGTDIPVGGTLDPNDDPITYAPVIVKVMEEVEAAAESITESGILTTPFSPDPPRQIEACIQQQVWIFCASITGEEYGKDDFAEKVYDQYEDNSGKEVTTLPEEQKEKLDSGIDDFWDVFIAVGVEAKVISDQSPGIDLDPSIMATVSTPGCRCKSISYDLEVKRGGIVVHDESHTTPRSPVVKMADFNYGDELEIKLYNIEANCNCQEAVCNFYPAESKDPDDQGYLETDLANEGKVDIEMENDPAGEIGAKGNNNCQNSDYNHDAVSNVHTFTIETRDENTKEKAVFQRLRIKAYCELPDCRRGLCAKVIQLNFVTTN